jgi:P27 family predicted phage terminase small subunit
MGARGPARTPTATLKLRGSKRAKEREAQEPKFSPGAPTCPSFLSTEAKAEWKRQAGQLQAAGVLALTDRAALAAYCEAWAEFRAAAIAIDAEVKADPAGGLMAAIAAGLVGLKCKAVERMTRLAREFGFTPASRSRATPIPKDEGKQADGKARFFNAN